MRRVIRTTERGEQHNPGQKDGEFFHHEFVDPLLTAKLDEFAVARGKLGEDSSDSLQVRRNVVRQRSTV
jgi:hypothetical protein